MDNQLLPLAQAVSSDPVQVVAKLDVNNSEIINTEH